jgi:hypothetical protein
LPTWNRELLEAAALRRTRPTEALSHARAAVQRQPADPAAWCVFVAILGDLRRFDDALLASRSLLALPATKYTASTSARALANAGLRHLADEARVLWAALENRAPGVATHELHQRIRGALERECESRDRERTPEQREPESEGSRSDDLGQQLNGLAVGDDRRLRVVRSRGQLDRASHHLENCLSSYWPAVRMGRTMIVTVEADRVPVEAIQIDPHRRVVQQWRGRRNRAPAPQSREAVSRALTSMGVMVSSVAAVACAEPF